MTDEQIMKLAQAYARHTGLKLTTLGNYAVRDGKFFEQLGNGRELRRRTRRKVAAWFDLNWVEDLEWPEDIPRPSQKAVQGAAT